MEQLGKTSTRECGMMVVVGGQGAGKTYLNKRIICDYVKDNLKTKVRGRKFLILDTQGEYATEQFGKDGIPPLLVKRIAVKDVAAWCRSSVIEARRIDLKSLHIDEKLEVLKYVSQQVINCATCFEDVNKVVLNMSQMKDIISSLIGLRHLGVDVIISYQSLRAVEPRILDNARYVRIHYFSGDPDLITTKLGDPDAFKLADLIVKNRYYAANYAYKANEISEDEFKKRRAFCVYLHTNPYKIEGAFTEEEFKQACNKFLRIRKKRIKDEMDLTGCDFEQALENQTELLINDYYGNSK